MRQVIIVVMGFILGTVFFLIVDHAHSKEAPKKEDDKIICVTNAELDKIMVEFNFAQEVLNIDEETGEILENE